MIRFRFVDDHRTDYSVKRMCTVLGLNRSSYYKWKASSAQRHRRLVDDAILGAKVKAIFDEKKQLYGAKRIAAELTFNDAYSSTGPVNHKRIARIMKKLQLRGYTKKRKVTTTQRGSHRFIFADLVKRNFTAPAANRTLVGDITYLPIADGSNRRILAFVATFPRFWSILVVRPCVLLGCRSPGSFAVDC